MHGPSIPLPGNGLINPQNKEGNSKYFLLNTSIPEVYINSWQVTTDLVASVIDVPVALIVRAQPSELEVFVRSNTDGNAFKPGDAFGLNVGVYCDAVLETQKPLLVSNAGSEWFIPHGMVSYFGKPLFWPSGQLFGTFCVLDNKENSYSKKSLDLIERFHESVQLNLNTIHENHLNVLEARGRLNILSEALEQSPVTVKITDLNGKIEYVNHATELASGFNSTELLGKKSTVFDACNTSPGAFCDIWEKTKPLKLWEGELHSRKKSGEYFWESVRLSPLLDYEGKLDRFMIIKEDITRHKKQEQEIAHQAFYDPLTNLPNRAMLFQQLQKMLLKAKQSKNKLALYFLDLDNFKQVNDTLGHEEGDLLLNNIAQRLQNTVRERDVVARFGGDEFVVVVNNIENSLPLATIMDNLLKQFKPVFKSNNRNFNITVSIGIAIYPENGENGSELLRNADTAMYRAKEEGRGGYCYYTKSMNQDVLRRFKVEGQLHNALEKDELYLCYQPLINVNNQALIGVEALLRWENAELGLVGPAEFIPIAEQSGLIVPIGQFVISEALIWMNSCKSQLDDDFKLAINISPRQLPDADFVSFIEKALESNSIAGSHVVLEITEGLFLNANVEIDTALRALKSIGIGLAMDDFGTGYSSLSYLRNYPFTSLKIDRGFIRGVPEYAEDKVLVESAIAMAHGLGLRVVAEGVETKEQLSFLKKLDCDIAQGYLFSKPLVEQEIGEFIRKIMH